MNGSVLGEELKKLIEEIGIVVVHLKLKGRFILKRSARHFGRYLLQTSLAAVAINPLGTLDLIEIGRRKVDAELEPILLTRLGQIA